MWKMVSLIVVLHLKTKKFDSLVFWNFNENRQDIDIGDILHGPYRIEDF
jgi:hypothetical protein